MLDGTFAVPGTGVRLAGQITGTEGYMEAVATGLLAALNTYAEAIEVAPVELPRVGALGALVGYATDPATVGYQPMHVNFGLVLPSRTVNAAANVSAIRPMRIAPLRPWIPIWNRAPTCLGATGHSL